MQTPVWTYLHLVTSENVIENAERDLVKLLSLDEK